MTTRALIFVDLAGSTRLYEQLGDQQALRVVQQALGRFCQTVIEHRGSVIKTMGDGLFAAFKEASDAVQACRSMQQQLKLSSTGPHPLKLRAGIHWGSVLTDPQGDLFGDAVNVSARLCDFAQPGQLLISNDLQERLPDHLHLVLRPCPTLQLRGRQQPLTVTEVLNDSEDATVLMSGIKLEPGFVLLRLELQQCERKTQLQMGDSLTLGRAPDCDWVLNGARISRHHARIESRHGQFFWIDISTNGSLVQTPESLLIHGRSWPIEGQGQIWPGGDTGSESTRIDFRICT